MATVSYKLLRRARRVVVDPPHTERPRDADYAVFAWGVVGLFFIGCGLVFSYGLLTLIFG